MRFPGRPFLPLLACWLVVGLSVTSCGGAETSATRSNGSMTLNVGQISDSVAFFPFYVAEQQGYFKGQGLTLGSRPHLGTGAKVATALVAGSIDIGGGVITDAFDLAKVDSQVKVIGSLVNGYYVDVTVSKSFDQAEAYIHNNPDKALALLEKYLHMNQQIANAVFTAIGPAFPQSPQIDQKGYCIAVQFHVQAGLIKAAPAYSDMIATDTINKALS